MAKTEPATDLYGLSDEEAKLFAELEESEAADVQTDIAAHLQAERDALAAPAEEPEGAPEAEDPAPEAPKVEPNVEAFDHTPQAIPAITDEQRAAIEGFEAAQKAVWDKFDDGDLTKAEAQEQIADLYKQANAAQAAQEQAEAAAQRENEAWGRVQVDWFKDHPEVHGLMQSDPKAFDNFDLAVRAYTGSALADGQSFRQQLDGALALFRSRFPDVAPEAKAEAPKKAPKRPPVETPSLAHVPAAGSGDIDGAFAALDALADRDPIAFEARFAALTPAQREQYLNDA